MQSAVILGTGPSLAKQRDRILALREADKIRIYGVNNTFNDFPLDCWIACDPEWHEQYGKIEGDFKKWHWDKSICDQYGYRYIEGRWGDGPNKCSGLSLDKSYIQYGHSSGYQALGLALHAGHREIYLAGYDMHYSGARHYFSGLSDADGEYPEPLRKYSNFKGLITCYETIASQPDLPCKIYNATAGSALTCFEFKEL